jgi:uncharacterized protein (TIGR02996 family)
MSDRDALLAAITANPDEDTPRLVYADWLEEHDQAKRAEFIRLQCQLAHLSRKSTEGKPLAKREKELQSQLFGHLDGIGFESVSFRRGFVGAVTANLNVLAEHFDSLSVEDAPAYALKVLPEDDDCEIYDDSTVEEAFANETLRRCVSLDLPCMGIDASTIICESKHLINLRRMNFPDNEAGPTIESVASPTFANLRWANFHNSDSAFDNPSIVPLAECPHLANLEYLDFSYCEQWSECLQAVAATQYWNRLRYLNLSTSGFTPNSVAELFATRNLPVLAELDLSSTFGDYATGTPRDGDLSCVAIADSPLFARLSKLWIGRNSITDEGAKALAVSTREVKLTLLDLSENDISDEGRRALVERFGQDVCVFERAEGDD